MHVTQPDKFLLLWRQPRQGLRQTGGVFPRFSSLLRRQPLVFGLLGLFQRLHGEKRGVPVVINHFVAGHAPQPGKLALRRKHGKQRMLVSGQKDFQ